MSAPSIRLSYLEFPGAAECIRLTLVVGGVRFFDRRLSYARVKELRAAGKLGPNGQVPILELGIEASADPDTAEGGEVFGQSAAILRWAGTKTGLYPDDPVQRLRVDGVDGVLADINTALLPQWYKNALPRNPKTGEMFAETALSQHQQDVVEQSLNADLLPSRMNQLEMTIQKSGGPYFCGATMTTSDLSFYALASGLLDGSHCAGIRTDLITQDATPALMVLLEKVGQHPAIVEWKTKGGNGGIWPIEK